MSELPLPDPLLREGFVLLRPWSREDVRAIVAACQDPVIPRFSPVIPFPYEESDALGWLEGQEPMRLAGEGLDLAVVHTESGSVIGAIGIGNVSTTLLSASLGYWLAAEARGHGYMTTAARMLARWAFDSLGLARLELTTDPQNVPSQRVAERCGFQREGHLRSHMLVGHSGERRDSLIYGLLPDDCGNSLTQAPGHGFRFDSKSSRRGRGRCHGRACRNVPWPHGYRAAATSPKRRPSRCLPTCLMPSAPGVSAWQLLGQGATMNGA
jgi:RimJ/RimL family protein N-acetyltransferase